MQARATLRDLAEHVSVALAALVWIAVLTRSSGGFHDPRTAWLAVALAPALLLTRPWRTVSALLLLAVVLCGVGATVVLMTSPPGWAQADSPAGQLVGLAALVVTVGYARTPARRLAIVATLAAAAMLQFYEAWLPWWGSGDPNHLMVGTFYWHNQLAAWMLGIGLLAGAVAVSGTKQLRLPCLVIAPFALSAIVLSTSRATLALLFLGYAGLLLLALRAHDRWRALARALSLPAVAAGLLVVLTSTAFFPTPDRVASPGPALSPAVGPAGDRSSASLKASGDERVLWTEAALSAWWRSPLAGDGFGSYPATSDVELPAGALRSAFAHNAYAEALASGGLLFGLPLLLVILSVAGAAVRALWRTLWGANDDGAVLPGAALAVLALLAHAGLDFDWHYTSLVVLFGVVGGLLVSSPRSPRRPRAGMALAALLLGVLAVSGAGSLIEHHGRGALDAGRDPTVAVEHLLAAQVGPFYDARLAEAALQRSIERPTAGPDQLAVAPDLGERVLARSRRAALLQPQQEGLRAELLALLNHPEEAQRLIEAVVRTHGARDPGLYGPYAQVMFLTGNYESARPAILAAARSGSDADTARYLLAVLKRLDGPTPSTG